MKGVDRYLSRGWIDQLADLLGPDRLLLEEPMAKHTTFRVGGPAEVLVSPTSRQEIRGIVEICRQAGQPWLVIGSGSNLLVRDGGIRGVVIELGRGYSHCTIEGCRLTAASGIRLSSLCRRAAERSLAGLEFAEGIPGSLGGAVYMNAGAYDGEISRVVTRVTSLDPVTGEEITRPAAGIGFAYRHSCYQHNGEIILEVSLLLEPGDRDRIEALMRDLAQRRRDKQPIELPSAGSTFKRPPGRFVAPLIEELGLKGYSCGGAQISEKHCGFIVNRGNATAADIIRLITLVQERAYLEKGVRLEPEIRIVGEEIKK